MHVTLAQCSLKYYLVFCLQYRQSVLLGPVAKRLQTLLAAKGQEPKVTLHTLEVVPDHVHMVVESDLGIAPAKLTAQFKGDTSQLLRQEFRHLRSQKPIACTMRRCKSDVPSTASPGHRSRTTIREHSVILSSHR
jgi:putative transposase